MEPNILHFKKVPGDGLMVENPPANAGDSGDLVLTPGLGRSPREGNCYPFQYSCLENPHGQRRLAGYSPRGHKESDMTERLSTAQHAGTVFTQRN